MARVPAQPATFVGRKDELEHIHKLWSAGNRLCTLAGPGGIGKTTTAIAAAHQFIAANVEVEWVELDGLDNPDVLAGHIATSIGAQSVDGTTAEDHLLTNLAGRGRMVLVLDNCEHLAGPVADLVADMLDAAAELTVLATSRWLLTLPEEALVLIDPLNDEDAVELFNTRARAVRPDSNPEQHQDDVLRIVGSVDRIPAAVEIRASQVRMMQIGEIAQMLPERADAFTSKRGGDQRPRRRRGRQRTFEELLDTSWELCSDADRALWQRASIFGGVSWTLDAAEQVCADQAGSENPELPAQEILPTINSLIEQSLLVVVNNSGTSRYRFLRPLQRYGRRRLQKSGQSGAAQDRHIAWVRSFYHQVARDWGGPHELEWLHSAMSELGNARTALDALLEEDSPEAALELADLVFRTNCPFQSGTLHEWCYHLERALARYPHRDEKRATALAQLTYYTVCMGQLARADATLSEAKGIAAELDIELPIVLTAEAVAMLFGHGDDACIDRATRAYELALSYAATSGEPEVCTGDLLLLQMWMAICIAMVGDRKTADARTVELLDAAESAGSPYHLTWLRWARASFLLLHVPDRPGVLGTAQALLESSLPQQQRVHDFWGPLWWIVVGCWIAAASGDYRRAAMLGGAVQRASSLTGIRTSQAVIADKLNKALRQAETGLGSEEYEKYYNQGMSVADYDEAITLASSRDSQLIPAAQRRLTKQLQPVAELAAQGFTNAEIALQLDLAEGSVKRYLTTIRKALGVTQREDIGPALGLPGS